MPAGIFFVAIGGWLLSRWTYSSSAFGLVNGRYVFWLRLNVTSRKLIICLLASIVSFYGDPRSKFTPVEHSMILRNGKIQHRLLDEEYTFTITQRLPATAY